MIKSMTSLDDLKSNLIEILEAETDDFRELLNLAQLDSQHDLTGADLSELDLREMNFERADLKGTNLSKSNLSGVNLKGADLSHANLDEASLSEANLSNAKLIKATLKQADLTFANLDSADFTGADLTGAILVKTIFDNTKLKYAILSESLLAKTVLTDIDFTLVKGLVEAKHIQPSTIAMSTIMRSKGKPALSFFKSAGLPKMLIDDARSQKHSAFHSLVYFLVYSHSDRVFAQRLSADLGSRGINCVALSEDESKKENLRSVLPDKELLIVSKNNISDISQSIKQIDWKTSKQSDTYLIQIDESLGGVLSKPDSIGNYSKYVSDFTKWTTKSVYMLAFDCLVNVLIETKKKQSR